MTMGQADKQGQYRKGIHTAEECNRKHIYVVDTVIGKDFIYVGTVEITMGEVWNAMNATRNIKDNMPSKFARKHAREKYPKANPILVMPLESWEDRYGKLSQYKAGDVVK